MSAPAPGTPGRLRVAVEARLADLTPAQRSLLLERRPVDQPEVEAGVRHILGDVRARGDEALREMALRYDGVELESLEVPRARWDDALEALDPGVRGALERAVRNIAAFHRVQVPADVELATEEGIRLGRRFVPLATVGVYAPGGRAAYPSSVLMGVVPARAAGVDEVVVCSPPSPAGEPPPEVLAAAALAGATRLFAVGGAGAVAAMAYGTATVPRCDAVVGPGNRWVAEAKRQVAGAVVIDAPAGPSEVLVVAGDDAPAELVAAELLAQAEHDPDAAVALVATSAALLEAVRKALARQVAASARRTVVEEALAGRGALLVAGTPAEALAFAEAWAPEHLALYTADPAADLAGVRRAGTVFLGPASSVAHGDYLTGANHVLPTAGTARSFSGLSALHFVRSYTWQEVTPAAAGRLAEDVGRLARAEGLPGHAEAAGMRGAGRRGEGTLDGAAPPPGPGVPGPEGGGAP
ncbi:MAG TPA: histidinol dehydrogenase [Longimicrobiales bacterium]|nr:histidinol dehydrogenase [Longimicrobiales bacterium]